MPNATSVKSITYLKLHQELKYCQKELQTTEILTEHFFLIHNAPCDVSLKAARTTSRAPNIVNVHVVTSSAGWKKTVE